MPCPNLTRLDPLSILEKMMVVEIFCKREGTRERRERERVRYFEILFIFYFDLFIFKIS